MWNADLCLDKLERKGQNVPYGSSSLGLGWLIGGRSGEKSGRKPGG